MRYIRGFLKLGCLLFCCSSFLTDLFSQGYNIKYLGYEQGLPERVITAIEQDDNGIMWFGSFHGIMRYDGVSFEVFTVEQNKPIFLHDNWVRGIIKTRSGALWVANEGITIIDPKTMTCQQVLSGQEIYGKYSGQTNAVDALYRDSSGVIWGSDQLGIFKVVNEDIHQLKRLKTDTKSHSCYYINRDESGTLWFVSYDNAYYLDRHDQLVLAYTNNGAPYFEHFFHPLNDTNGHFIGIYLEKEKKYVWARPSYAQQTPEILDWHFFRKNYPEFHRDLAKLVTAGDIAFFQYYQSSDNTTWIGTQYGLFKIQTNHTQFVQCPDLFHCSTRGLLESQQGNSIYVASYSGLMEYFPSQNRAVMLDRDHAYSLIAQDKNRLLIISELHGLKWWDLKTHQQTYISGLPKLETTFSPGYYLDKDNTVLFGNGGTIYKYDIGRNQVRQTAYFLSGKVDSIGGQIFALFKDYQHNVCWASTYSGFFGIEENKGIRTFPFSNDERLGKNSHINCIYQAQNGDLWLASKRYGILHLRVETGTIVSYTTNEGLSNNETYSIMSNDGGNTLWISTANGLNRFDVKQHTFETFFESAGLAHHEFNAGSFLKTSDGMFYFGGINGISRFDPRKIESQASDLSVLIVNYKIYNKLNGVTQYNSFGQLPPRINLSPYDNIIEFNLSATGYFEPEKNKYTYQLVGFDKNWVRLDNSSQIRYMNLPAGDYTLNIKVASSEGHFSKQELRLPIHIEQIYYKTNWFFALMAASLGLAIWILIKARYRQIEKENLIRLNISANIHDDFGTLLYGINASAQKLTKCIVEDNARSEVDKLVHLCEEGYRSIGQLIWVINPDNQLLFDFLRRIEDFKDSILSAHSNITSFETRGFALNKKIPIELNHHLCMIFKEAFVNIVKHTKPHKIEILIQNTPSFSFRISNQFTEKLQHPFSYGNGLENMKKRAEQIGAKIEIDSTPNYFIIFFQLKKSL